jgi:hypothetical protein
MNANGRESNRSSSLASIRGSASCAIQTMDIQEGLLLKATVRILASALKVRHSQCRALQGPVSLREHFEGPTGRHNSGVLARWAFTFVRRRAPVLLFGLKT